jgi:hypothetical protein
MRYLLLLHVEESGWSALTPAAQAEAMSAYGAYNAALAQAGVLVEMGRLAPSAGAAAVRTKGGQPIVTDGPYAETKEQIGGFYLIEAETRQAALAWAAGCPAAGHGAVEVRAVA